MKTNPQKVIDGIIGYLKNENLLHIVPELIFELKKISDQQIKKAVVETAIELTPNEKKEFKDLTDKKFGWKGDMEYVVDPDLLGGAKVTVGDQVLDLSVRAKIKNIYDQT
jgi:F-type H+-transporting ATPase subunit delta